MHFNTLKQIVSLSLTLLVSSVAFAASVKPAQLKETLYCQDQEKLKGLASVVHLDERNKIDRIVIQKKTKQLHLISQGRIYKTYNVAFGFGSLEGNKIQAKDGRTPEGFYHVELKKGLGESSYTQALRVSYPNDFDKAFARSLGVNTGGDIMIHGFPSNPNKARQLSALEVTHPRLDWTEGCIAVTNEEIKEIFSAVEVNTSIEICPR